MILLNPSIDILNLGDPNNCYILAGRSSNSNNYQGSYSFRLTYNYERKLRFKFGCEEHPLKSWTEKKIKDLCKKHKEPKFYNEILFLVRLARGTFKIAKTNFKFLEEAKNG